MEIDFQYEIVAVNSNSMEVMFTATGYESRLVGTRLPFVGETLEDVLMSYAPIQFWVDSKKTLNPPTVNTTGSLKYSDTPTPTPTPSPTVSGAQSV